jgi:hypothetical protein
MLPQYGGIKNIGIPKKFNHDTKTPVTAPFPDGIIPE